MSSFDHNAPADLFPRPQQIRTSACRLSPVQHRCRSHPICHRADALGLPGRNRDESGDERRADGLRIKSLYDEQRLSAAQ